MWAGEMSQQLRALVAPIDKLDSVTPTHMVSHKYLELQFQGI